MDNVKATIDITELSVGGVTAGFGIYKNLSGITKKLTTVRAWAKFNNLCKGNVSLSNTKLLAAWTKITTNALSLTDNIKTLESALSGDLKSTFDEIVKAGLKYTDDGQTIKIFDKNNVEIATIFNGKLTPQKWISARNNEVISNTESGYRIVKSGEDFGFDIGYKEGRVLSAEEVNSFYKGIGKQEPYKPLTIVNERSLQPGDKIYIVEDKIYKLTSVIEPNPGMWGSKNIITTEKELREYLAVLESWKKSNGILEPLVVREYTVIKQLKVRDGVVGPQMEKFDGNSFKVYYGGEHQYEFVEFMGNGNWRNFMTVKNTEGTILK